MSRQCTNGVPKCSKCSHRHWAVDTCQEYKERMAARECYTCGEKGHVAKKCKKSASHKQRKKDNDVLTLEDICWSPPEDRDFEAERRAEAERHRTGQYDFETQEDFFYAPYDFETQEDVLYAPQHVDEVAEWPAPWLTETDQASESDSSSDSDYERDCLQRYQQTRDVANPYPWEDIKMHQQSQPLLMDTPLETQQRWWICVHIRPV